MLARSYLIVLVILTAMAAVGGSDDGEPAPRFHAKTTSGESYTNESIKGKVVLLEFWTTWCPYCKNEEALVDGIDHEFADKGLMVLAVDVAESKKKIKQYLQENPRSCRIVLTEYIFLSVMCQPPRSTLFPVTARFRNIPHAQRGGRGG